MSTVSSQFDQALVARLSRALGIARGRAEHLAAVLRYVEDAQRAAAAGSLARERLVLKRDLDALRAVHGALAKVDASPVKDLQREATAAVSALHSLLWRMEYPSLTWQRVSASLTKAGLTRSGGTTRYPTPGFTTKVDERQGGIRVSWYADHRRPGAEEQIEAGMASVRAALASGEYEVGPAPEQYGVFVRLPVANPPTAEEFLAAEPLLAEVETWAKPTTAVGTHG